MINPPRGAYAARFYTLTMELGTTRENIQLRMLSILMQHLEGDTLFSYNHTNNTVYYQWNVRNAQGDFCYIERGTCTLDQWFTEDEQMHVLDLLTPRL